MFVPIMGPPKKFPINESVYCIPLPAYMFSDDETGTKFFLIPPPKNGLTNKIHQDILEPYRFHRNEVLKNR